MTTTSRWLSSLKYPAAACINRSPFGSLKVHYTIATLEWYHANCYNRVSFAGYSSPSPVSTIDPFLDCISSIYDSGGHQGQTYLKGSDYCPLCPTKRDNRQNSCTLFRNLSRRQG